MNELWGNIDLNGVKGILCDLDDTLYDYEHCHQAGYAAARELAGSIFGLAPADFDLHWAAARKKVHHDLKPFAAGHSRLLYAQKLGESWFGHTHPGFTLQIEEAYWSVFLEQMKWHEEAETLFADAVAKGLVICIVTDLTAQIQHRKWEKLGLGRYVRYMVSSEEAGYEKPEPSIFKLALEKMNMQAEDVIMIGDSMRKDIEGARALGIRAYCIKKEA